jgi:CTP:molybdopterin cytidylyltransferase MocA
VNPVLVIILHAVPGPGAGPLESAFAAARKANADRHARGFRSAGAEVRVIETRAGGAPFGARLRRLAALDPGSGIVVLGSGSVPLTGPADRRAFVAAAAGAGHALTNNRFSGDIVAIPAGKLLAELPDLTADNGLPRWLSDRGIEVRDLLSRWRLQVDLDSPIDVVVAGLGTPGGIDEQASERMTQVMARVRERASDPSRELLVAGRSSADTLAWLEKSTASRTRALVEERGMRTVAGDQRPPRSILGLVLDREGPEALGRLAGELADAAVIDSRVLLAHRLGPDESAWPPPEDRFASDLLLVDRVADPWLAALTRSAAEASIPVLLGGHTLVGPGLRLILGPRRR